MVQTPVPLDKLSQCQMNRITFLANPDDLQHAQILQLVQHQLLIVVVWCFLHVWLDTPHIPEFLLHQLKKLYEQMKKNMHLLKDIYRLEKFQSSGM